jgi:hypothetical protein
VKVPDRAPDRVRDGEYEPTGRGYRTWEPRWSLFAALFSGKPQWESVVRERWGRKRYEYWDPPKAEPMFEEIPTASPDVIEVVVTYRQPEQRDPIGRWYWVPEPRHHPAGSPPLPQTCTRDFLEDEMGYEEAVRYIGARECEFGFPLALSAVGSAVAPTDPES